MYLWWRSSPQFMIVDASEEPQNVSKCTSVLKGKYSLFNLEHWAVLFQLLPSKPFIYHKLFSTLAPRVDFFFIFAIFAAATFFYMHVLIRMPATRLYIVEILLILLSLWSKPSRKSS